MHYKFLQPKEELTATQRKSLGLPKTPPREKHPDEAGPRIYVNASQRDPYVPTELNAPPARAGSMAAYNIKSKGF